MFWRKKKQVRDAKTAEKCTACGKQTVRDFTAGDTLFGDGAPCSMCKKPTSIWGIYGQIREP